jgi:hypothetical protein
MRYKVTIARDQKTQYIVLRYDELKPIGSKIKYGSGKAWTIVDYVTL